jgi:hypothetical protein
MRPDVRLGQKGKRLQIGNSANTFRLQAEASKQVAVVRNRGGGVTHNAVQGHLLPSVQHSRRVELSAV